MLLGCLEARLPWWDLTMWNSFLLLGKDGGCEGPLKRTGKPLSSCSPGTFSLIGLSSGAAEGVGRTQVEVTQGGRVLWQWTVLPGENGECKGGLEPWLVDWQENAWRLEAKQVGRLPAFCSWARNDPNWERVRSRGWLWALGLLGYVHHLFHP